MMKKDDALGFVFNFCISLFYIPEYKRRHTHEKYEQAIVEMESKDQIKFTEILFLFQLVIRNISY